MYVFYVKYLVKCSLGHTKIQIAEYFPVPRNFIPDTMKNRIPVLIAVLALILAIGPSTPVLAQSFSLGADVYNRYVWRGFDYGESLSIQPTLEFSTDIVTIGSWASYSVAADGSGANEHDLYVSFALGPVSLGVTDYYFPSPGGSEFWDWSEDGGSHLLELNAGIGGTEAFPVTLSANIFFYNETDNSVYLEVGYPFTIDDVDLGLAVGIVPMESAFYATSTFGVVNAGLSASKEIKITDSFSLPISAAYVLNPTPGSSRSFLLFGFSL